MANARKRQYSFSQHGQSDRGGQIGNYCFKPGVVDHWSPPYENGVLTFRIFPAVNLEDSSQFDPYRWPSSDPDEPMGFGDWLRRYPAVRNIGQPGVTYLYDDPSDSQVEDIRMTPAWVLYNAIDQAINQKVDRPGWAAMLRGGAGRGAQLPKPAEIYLMQGCILMWRNNAYQVPRGIGDDDRTTVLTLSPSAGTALLQQCFAENPEYSGDPDDIEARFVNGDPISLDTGRFVTIYSLSDGDPRQAQQMQPQGWQTQTQRTPGLAGGGREEKPIGYGCFMEPAYGALPARLREAEAAVRSKVRPWSEVINIPTLEQQAQLLADKFPPDVICYAWQDSHPEWVPEDIARRAVAAAQVPVGGAVAPVGQPGMAAAPFAGGQVPPQPGTWPAGAAPVAPGTPQAFVPAQQGPVTAEAATAAVAAGQPVPGPAPVQPPQGAPVAPPPLSAVFGAPPTAVPGQPPADGAVPAGAIPAEPVGPAPAVMPPQVPNAAVITPAEQLVAEPGLPAPSTAPTAGPHPAPAWPAAGQSAFPQSAPPVSVGAGSGPVVGTPPPPAQLAPPAQVASPPQAAPPPQVASPPQAAPPSAVSPPGAEQVAQVAPVAPSQAAPPPVLPPTDPAQMTAAQQALARAQAARNQGG